METQILFDFFVLLFLKTLLLFLLGGWLLENLPALRISEFGLEGFATEGHSALHCEIVEGFGLVLDKEKRKENKIIMNKG